jgi:predicted nucleic acid-binding Zn ribbon protein
MNRSNKPQPRKNSFSLEKARRSVLSEWRGIDLTSLERTRADTAKPAGKVMPRVLANLGLDRRRTDLEVLKVWNHSIDPNIVAHARPTGLHKGTLFVTVDNSVWLSEIVRYRRKEILTRLQHSFGREFITRISFRVG